MGKLIGHLLLACGGSFCSHMVVLPATMSLATAAGQMRAFVMIADMPMRARIAAVR